MSITETVRGEIDFPEPLKYQGPDLDSLSDAVIWLATREEPTVTSDSPGNVFLANGTKLTDIPHLKGQSPLDFERWLMDIPANTLDEQLTFNL